MGYRNLSIRNKLFLPAALVIVSIVVFQALFFPSVEKANATNALEAKGLSLCRLVAHGVGAAVEYGDEMVATERLSGAAEDEDVIYIALYAEDGTLLADYDLDRAPDNLDTSVPERPAFLRTDQAIHVRFPVEKNDVRGTLVAGFSMAGINEDHNRTLGTGAFIGLIILFFGFAVTYWLGITIGNRLGVLAGMVEEVASGNLNQKSLEDNRSDEIGSMVRSFNRMVVSQRELVSQIADTALWINSSAGQILASSQHQMQGATEQSSAVEETRRTMETLLESGREIGDTAGGVLSNAELTYSNNQQIAESISKLSIHTQRISEILEVIKDIANKTDLLALNAALEGTKAGEAGRGFSLVATQMQRLADNVMRSAVDIKNLTADIRASTSASVLATEEATKLASDTTQSARRINLIVQQQQTGTEQVSTALDDIHSVAQQTVAGSHQTVEATRELVALSEKLKALIGTFNYESDGQDAEKA